MLLHLAGTPVPGYDKVELQLHNAKGSILPASRQRILKAALEAGATHLLFIDSDQTFPADLAHRLLSHGKLVVGCNVATKVLPPSTTARMKDGTASGAPFYTERDSKDLVKVWRLGTGVLLLNLNIFKREELKKPPHFQVEWNEERGDYTGEDWFFMERLEKAGVSIWVDQSLSRQIGHVGSLNYGHDMIAAHRGAA